LGLDAAALKPTAPEDAALEPELDPLATQPRPAGALPELDTGLPEESVVVEAEGRGLLEP